VNKYYQNANGLHSHLKGA